jgi:hypothetical protein
MGRDVLPLFNNVTSLPRSSASSAQAELITPLPPINNTFIVFQTSTIPTGMMPTSGRARSQTHRLATFLPVDICQPQVIVDCETAVERFPVTGVSVAM